MLHWLLNPLTLIHRFFVHEWARDELFMHADMPLYLFIR